MNDTTCSDILLKPDAIDTPIYEKPNAYDELPAKVVSRHSSRSSRTTIDSFKSRYFQKRGPAAISCIYTPPSSTITSPTGEYYSANTPIQSPPSSPTTTTTTLTKKRSTSFYNACLENAITNFVLSQATPTTQTQFNHHHEDTISIDPTILNPSSPKNSVIGLDISNKTTDVAAAAAALLSNDSNIVSSFFLQRNRSVRTNGTTTTTHKKLVAKRNSNVIVYSVRKKTMRSPRQHEIYLHIDHADGENDEDVMVYRKVQPYSFFWTGFHSMLYSNRNDGQGIKVAEARRGPFDTKIAIESADYDNSLIEDIAQPYIKNLKDTPASNNIHRQNLTQRSQSNILFEYEIWFHGSRMRWKRPSLLSHDFTCEIKLTNEETKRVQQQRKRPKSYQLPLKKKKKKVAGFIDSDSEDDEDDHDHHTHKTCRRWKLIAEFDSHAMNDNELEYGKLSIDLDIANQVEQERCNLLEAHIVMTCCTLIDQIRDVMGK